MTAEIQPITSQLELHATEIHTQNIVAETIADEMIRDVQTSLELINTENVYTTVESTTITNVEKCETYTDMSCQTDDVDAMYATVDKLRSSSVATRVEGKIGESRSDAVPPTVDRRHQFV